MTQNNSQKILNKYEKSNRLISEKYLNGEQLFSEQEIKNRSARSMENIPAKESIDALSSSLIEVSKKLAEARGLIKQLQKSKASKKKSH